MDGNDWMPDPDPERREDGPEPLSAAEARALVERREAEVTALEDEIAELCANLFAGTYRLLVLINEWEARECLQHRWGLKSTAHWLAWRCGFALGVAREHVRVARALKALPVVAYAFSRGMLSYSKVRAITRVATAQNERALVSLARHATGAQLERIIRVYRRVEALNDPEQMLRQQRRRGLSWRFDDDGMLVLHGRFTPDDGAVLVRCLEAMYARIGEKTRDPEAEDPVKRFQGDLDTDADDPPAVRRADALLRLVETGAQGEPQPLFGGERVQVVLHVPVIVGTTPGEGEHGPNGAAACETSTRQDVSAGTRPDPAQRGRAHPDRAHRDQAQGRQAQRDHAPRNEDAAGATTVDQASRTEERACSETLAPPAPAPHLDPGTAISWETTRRLACDASRVLLKESGHMQPLGVGRKSRAVPPALRRALDARDDGCRFPGCTERRFVDAHHIVHWADGGETALDNLVLLCRYHHVLVHEKGFGCQRTVQGEIVFTTPTGNRMPPTGELPALFDADVRGGLEARNHRRGIHVSPAACHSLSGGGPYEMEIVIGGLLEASRSGAAPLSLGEDLDERFPPPRPPGRA